MFRTTFSPTRRAPGWGWLALCALVLGSLFAQPARSQVPTLDAEEQAFVALRTGQPTALKPPLAGYAESLPPAQRATLDQLLSCSAIGSPETVRAAIHAFVERTGADELMITSQIHDHEKRLRSYEIVADCVSSMAATA